MGFLGGQVEVEVWVQGEPVEGFVNGSTGHWLRGPVVEFFFCIFFVGVIYPQSQTKMWFVFV